MLATYLNGLTFLEKGLFLLQLPVIFFISRIKKRPLYSIDLIIPIKKKKNILSLIWENPEKSVPNWFCKFDFTSLKKLVFLDVGANIGLFSALFLKKGGKKAYLFEINPSINKILAKAANETKENKIVLCGHGLSKTDTEEEIYFDSPYSLMGTLDGKRYENKNGFKKRGTVKVHSLDTIADSLFKNEKIGLIKIDVEGVEDKVLLGARKTLKKHHPIIIFEANRTGDFEKCEKILKPIGYKFRALDKNNWLAT